MHNPRSAAIHLRNSAVVAASAAVILALPFIALTAHAQTAPTAAPAAAPAAPTTPSAELFANLKGDLDGLSAGVLNESFMASGAATRQTGSELCAQANVLPARCELWLMARYSDKTCAETGITTKDTCARYLSERNDSVFPGCEGKSTEDCAAVKDLALLPYLSEDIKKKADQTISTVFGKKEVGELPGLLPFAGSALKDTDWWKSSAAAGAETSVGVLVIDTDGDKITDDFERAVGTDPLQKDTDGDGKTDTEELRAGTNPTGEGNLATELTPPQKAFAFRKPFEQPRGSGAVREDFRVQLASSGGANTFSGRCRPDSLCILYVYSYIPLVLAITTDANGDYTYTIDRNLVDGEHSVYVAITDETGKIAERSNPLALFVKEAQAVTEDEFLRADVNVTRTPATQTNYFMWGAAMVILLGALAAWRVAAKPRPQAKQQ